MCFQHVVGEKKNSNALIARFPGFDFFFAFKIAISIVNISTPDTFSAHFFVVSIWFVWEKFAFFECYFNSIDGLKMKQTKKTTDIFITLPFTSRIIRIEFFFLRISRTVWKIFSRQYSQSKPFLFHKQIFFLSVSFFLNSRLNWMNLFFLSTVKVII